MFKLKKELCEKSKDGKVLIGLDHNPKSAHQIIYFLDKINFF